MVRCSQMLMVVNQPVINDKLASLEAAVNDCASQLIAKLRRDPEEISEPYVKQFNSLKTNSALFGALKTSGNASEQAPIIFCNFIGNTIVFTRNIA